MNDEEIQERLDYLVREWNRFVDEVKRSRGVNLRRVNKLGDERRANAIRCVRSDRWWRDYRAALLLIPHQPKLLEKGINFGDFVQPGAIYEIQKGEVAG